MARDTDLERMSELAGRIRRRLSAHVFDIADAQTVHTTCSIGFACYPFNHQCLDALSWEQVISVADRALYAAKASGPQRLGRNLRERRHPGRRSLCGDFKLRGKPGRRRETQRPDQPGRTADSLVETLHKFKVESGKFKVSGKCVAPNRRLFAVSVLALDRTRLSRVESTGWFAASGSSIMLPWSGWSRLIALAFVSATTASAQFEGPAFSNARARLQPRGRLRRALHVRAAALARRRPLPWRLGVGLGPRLPARRAAPVADPARADLSRHPPGRQPHPDARRSGAVSSIRSRSCGSQASGP